ncbi:MAG TPA: universal stress protein [Baekduia sp.]|nr:universal stress protein [Baekduia sp.]
MAAEDPIADQPPERPTPLGELRFNRLLVAIDGSESAELALSAAVTVARRDRSALTLLVVVPDFVADAARWPSPGAPDPRTMQEEADAAAERLLRETVDRIPEDISVTKLVRRGRAAQEIVAQTEAQDYDAVLLGARGLGRVGALLGSVSNHVLRHAATDVFVAHARPHRGDAAG